MLNFEEWNKTHVVIFDEEHVSTGQLRIWSKTSGVILPDDTLLTFDSAFNYAKQGMKFYPSEELSSIKIYLELQKELNRPVRDYVFLSVMNWKTKEKLVCPKNADEELVKQFHLANAILGHQDEYELLSDDWKSSFDSNKRFVEGIVDRNQ